MSTGLQGLLIVLAFMALILAEPIAHAVHQVYDDQTSPQPWFAADFSVPPHRVGSNPYVRYDRTINRRVVGPWGVKVWRLEGDQRHFVCDGDAPPESPGNYSPAESGAVLLRLNVFIGAGEGECRWTPDTTYQMCVTHDLRDFILRVERPFGPVCREFQTLPEDP